jgi:TRAP-type C4-dicarboxylate transport system permease small subunit
MHRCELNAQHCCPVTKGFLMNPVKVIAVVLIVGGIFGLAYGGFSYTKDTTVVKLGPLEVSAKEKQTVNVPMWAGVGAVVVGGLLLVFGSKR